VGCGDFGRITVAAHESAVKLRKRLAEIEAENGQICQNPFVRAPDEMNLAFIESFIKALRE
jgi:hypothetical protein